MLDPHNNSSVTYWYLRYQLSFLGTQRFTKVCPHVTPICSSEPQRLWKMATLVPGRPHWLERPLTLVFQTRHKNKNAPLMMNKRDALKCNGSYVHPNNDAKTKQSCNPSVKCLALGLWPAVPAVPISTAGFEVEKESIESWKCCDCRSLRDLQGPLKDQTPGQRLEVHSLEMNWLKKSITKSQVFLVGPCHSSNLASHSPSKQPAKVCYCYIIFESQ